MFDILFDIHTREIVMNGSGSTSDFATTQNPSDQNAGILVIGQGFNPEFPMFGVGINNTINGNANNLAYELNRWKAQSFIDNRGGGQGAIVAKWTATNDGFFTLETNYL